MKLCNYLSGELTFDCEYVGDIAISEPFRPKLVIGPCVHQLSADVHSTTGTLHVVLCNTWATPSAFAISRTRRSGMVSYRIVEIRPITLRSAILVRAVKIFILHAISAAWAFSF